MSLYKHNNLLQNKEGQDKELSSKPLNMGSTELPQEEMQKAEHRHNKPLEIPNSTGETENMQVATNINVDTANAVTQGDVGTVVGEVFFGVSPVPKVACQETSSGPKECETSEDEKNLVVTEEKSEEEGQRETSYQDGEESGVSIISVGKEMDSEVTRPRKETEEEKNGREEISTEKESPDNLNDKEVQEKEEGAKDNLGGPLVGAVIEETSSKMAEQDDGGKLEDNSSIPFDERSTKTTESSEKTDVASIEDEKPSLVEKIEDIGFQDDLENPTEILGEIVTTDTNVHTRGADEENSEPKVDASFTRQEEILQKESEVLAPTEVSTREYTDKERFGAALPHMYSNTESAEHEEQSEQGLFTKIEPGEEKLERSLEVAPEEIKNKASSQQVETITAFKEQGPIESFEEIPKEERKETTYHTDDIGKESSEEKVRII